MSITSGLAPIRNYANGGDINTKRQNMLAKLGFPSGMTNEDLDAAIAEEERISSIASGGNAPKTAEEFKQDFKDYVFDPTDPVDVLTAPLYAAGPAGIAANRAIKTGRVANKAFKPSGIQSFLSKPGVNVGIPSATLAGDVTYDLATDEEFMGDIKTIAGIEDDALDQANEDLKKVNEEEQEVADAEDMEDPSEEEGKGLAGLQDQLAVFQSMMAPGKMTGGNIIASSGIDTPEIRRYEAGGIASLEPVMMANGGIAKFATGKEVIGKIIKKGSKTLADIKSKSKKKKADKAKAKADEAEAKAKKAEAEVKETGVTKDKPVDPRDSYIPEPLQPVLSGAAAIGKKVFSPSKYSPDTKQQIGASLTSLTPAAIGATALTAYANRDKNEKPPGTGSDTATVPKIEESNALKDILYQNSLERAISAGRTEPSFMDYLASFPGSYTEKVGKDPEFAKQMMAGFMAMMKPTEGFVPRNALVDFGEAAYAEQARQQDAVPDQLQLIERLRDDPDLLKAFRQINQDAPDPVTDQKLIGSLKETLLSNLYPGGYDEESEIIDKITEKKITDIELLQRYRDSGGNYTEMLKTLTAKAD